MNYSAITPTSFAEAVFEYFDFLVSRYSFVIQQRTQNHFVAEKGDIRFNIALERGVRPNVNIELLQQTIKNSGRINRIGLVRLVECLDSKADIKMKFIRRQTDLAGMRENLEKYSLLAKKYCSRILEGDISQWPEIENCLEELSRKFKEET